MRWSWSAPSLLANGSAEGSAGMELVRASIARDALLVAILGVLVAVVYVYPDVRFVRDLGRNYAGIHLMGALDETLYLGRIRGVYKGDYRLANVGIYEHRDDPYLLPPLPEVMEGTIGKALGLPIDRLDMTFTFVMPVVVFLAAFWLAFRLSGAPRTALLASLSLVLGYHLFTPHLAVLRKVFLEGVPLFFVRPVSPQLHFAPFLLALVLVFRALERGGRGRTALAGVGVGLLFYFNVLYYWSFLLAGLAVLAGIATIARRPDLVRRIVVIVAIALVLSVPYWLEALSAQASPHIADMLERHGIERGRRPDLPLAQILLSALILLVFRPKRDIRYWFIAAFLVGGAICLNQQVVTGLTIQSFHWQAYTNKAFMILALVVTAATAIRTSPERLRSALFYAVTVVLVAAAVVQQDVYYRREAGTYRDLQPLAKPLQWLTANTRKEDVVLVDPSATTINEAVSIYTDNYVYLSLNSLFISLASREEVEERYLWALRFFGYSRDEAAGLFRRFGGDWSSPSKYGLWGHAQQIEEHLRRLEKKYAVLLARDGTPLSRYKIDYVLVSADRSERLADGERQGHLRLVYDEGRFKIFRYVRAESG